MGTPPRFLSDDQLAARAGEGSKAAEAEIFARHHRALVGFCRSIVFDAHDADEAAQSALVKAIAALRRKPLDAPLRPWLFRIAHNEAIDILRSRRRHVALDDVTAVVPSADVTIDQRERLTQLVNDLQALPERQRSALLMREMSGLPYPEIAMSLETTEHATRQIVCEARRALTEFREGRQLECSSVRDVLEAGDRRVLRGKRLRAHLRGCPDCHAIQAGMATRRRDLRLLIPGLPATGLAALLGGAATGGAVKMAVGALAVTATVGVVEHEIQTKPDPAPKVIAAKPEPKAKAKRPERVKVAPAAKPEVKRKVRRPQAAPVVKAPAPKKLVVRHSTPKPQPVVTAEPQPIAVKKPKPATSKPAKPVSAEVVAPATTPVPTPVQTAAPVTVSIPTSFNERVRANNQAVLNAALADAKAQLDTALANAQTATKSAMTQAQAQLDEAMAQLAALKSGTYHLTVP